MLKQNSKHINKGQCQTEKLVSRNPLLFLYTDVGKHLVNDKKLTKT